MCSGDGPGGPGRVVLGLGGTVDVELVWDADALGAVADELGVRVEDADPGLPVVDERSLVAVLLGFLRTGQGGERFAASSDLIRAFASRFEHRVTLGGTNIRAAIAMDVLGVASTVHVVSIDATMRRLLPARCAEIHVTESEALDPHLIVQFPAGAAVRVGGETVVAPHPNRVILANDPPNRELVLAPGLRDAVRGAEVVLLSTLNVIQEPEVLAARLTELAEIVTGLPEDAVVLWEDAGYHRPELRAVVTDVMVGLSDVYSLNEDEMAAFLGRPVDLLDAGDLLAGLEELSAVVPARTLVVHSACWALAVGERAGGLRGALRGGIAMAGARYLRGDGVTRGDYDAMLTRTPRPDSLALAATLESARADLVCEAAYRLDVDVPTTIGLGDTFVGGFVAALVSGPRSPVVPMPRGQ